jgi:hypothetical protein
MGGGDRRRAGHGRDADDDEQQRDERDAGARECAQKMRSRCEHGMGSESRRAVL